MGLSCETALLRVYNDIVTTIGRGKNNRLGTDYYQLIMPISKDSSNTFLERLFMYAAPCEWNKLSEHIRTSNFDFLEE